MKILGIIFYKIQNYIPLSELNGHLRKPTEELNFELNNNFKIAGNYIQKKDTLNNYETTGNDYRQNNKRPGKKYGRTILLHEHISQTTDDFNSDSQTFFSKGIMISHR